MSSKVLVPPERTSDRRLTAREIKERTVANREKCAGCLSFQFHNFADISLLCRGESQVVGIESPNKDCNK